MAGLTDGTTKHHPGAGGRRGKEGSGRKPEWLDQMQKGHSCRDNDGDADGAVRLRQPACRCSSSSKGPPMPLARATIEAHARRVPADGERRPPAPSAPKQQSQHVLHRCPLLVLRPHLVVPKCRSRRRGLPAFGRLEFARSHPAALQFGRPRVRVVGCKEVTRIVRRLSSARPSASPHPKHFDHALPPPRRFFFPAVAGNAVAL